MILDPVNLLDSNFIIYVDVVYALPSPHHELMCSCFSTPDFFLIGSVAHIRPLGLGSGIDIPTLGFINSEF